jgi:hypothetical protein
MAGVKSFDELEKDFGHGGLRKKKGKGARFRKRPLRQKERPTLEGGPYRVPQTD